MLEYTFEKLISKFILIIYLYLKGSFTNFKPSWHNMSYELGSMESFEHQSNQSRHNSSTSSPLKTNSKQLNSDSFILSDILPSKDDYNKRWSSEMDSNILF